MSRTRMGRGHVTSSVPKSATRKRTIAASRFMPGGRLVTPGAEPLVDLTSGERYLIEELIGTGGFGGVYRARWLQGGKPHNQPVCIKTTRYAPGWHREAYFGEVLQKHPGAVQVLDTFVGQQGEDPPVFCTVLELCAQSVANVLAGGGLRWTETQARTEFRRVV